MDAIELLLQQPAARALGWALLQFVWQGALIGGLTAAVLFAMRRGAADVRYAIATIGLTLMITMPAVSAVQGWRAIQPDIDLAPVVVSRTHTADTADATAVAAATAPAQSIAPVAGEAGDVGFSARDARATLESWLPAILLAWLSGVAILTLRLLTGWAWVERLRSHGTRPAAEEWQRIAVRIARQLHLARPVRLLESAIVEVPTVIGWLRPVVLLPASALSGLAPHQLEAILAHELAHIRRHDYLVNLLQTLVETLLFYHPAVWWLSRRIRIERENCCDDLAVNLCGDPYTYARALADLEALRGGSARLALAVTGGSLLRRVKRVLGAPPPAGPEPGWLAGSVAVLLLAGIAAGSIGNTVFGSERAGGPAGTVEQGQDGQQPPPAPPVPPVPPVSRVPVVEPPQPPPPTPPARPARPLAPLSIPAPPAGQPLPPPAPPASPLPPLPPTPAAAPPAPPASPLPPPPAAPSAGIAPAPLPPHLPPVPSTAPAPPPAPPAPPERMFESFGQSRESRGNFSWSDGKHKLEVSYRGEIQFTDDDADVKSISPGGWLRIRESGLPGDKAVEFRADASGTLQRKFWVGSTERPFEPEGRQWLKDALPRFIRQTGIGAEGRVKRILQSKGPDGVLAEISLIQGSWAKRIYFTELLKSSSLDAPTTRRVLVQAGTEIDSDYELATLLIGSADRLLVDNATRQAYFDAVRTIDSDYEMRRVYGAALKLGSVSSELLAGVLGASTSIDSDYEEASLLMQIAALQPLDARTRPAFFKALATVSSDYEHRRVLNSLASRGDLDSDNAGALLDSATTIGSDYEQAELLIKVARDRTIDGSTRGAFFRAVGTIESSYDRGRVLKVVAGRTDLTSETLLSVLKAAQGMGSGSETADVLRAIAAAHQLTGEARDLYVATAERLGDYDENRALAALGRQKK
jgi:beta-lactamase regulating signal transducer with metallopeptidase domain